MGLQGTAATLSWRRVDAIAIGREHLRGGMVHLWQEGRHDTTREHDYPPLLCAYRSRFHGHGPALGARWHPRQEHLHRCQGWREMAEHLAGAPELLQTTNLIDMQDARELLHQGR